jgi:hypothetical protein
MQAEIVTFPCVGICTCVVHSVSHADEQGVLPWGGHGTSFITGSVCWIDVSSTDPGTSMPGCSAGLTRSTRCGRHTTALCAGGPGGRSSPGGHLVTWTVYLDQPHHHTAAVLSGGAAKCCMDVSGHGRVLIGADPTGGVIGFWRPAKP